MRRVIIVVLAAMLAAGCADILGLDPLGPAVRTDNDDDDEPVDSGVTVIGSGDQDQ